MPCFHPRQMFPTRKPDPAAKPGERGRFTCDPAEGWCDVAGVHAPAVVVPCGVCRGCRLRRCGEWVLRCWWELQEPRHEGEASFLTLSFRDDDLPDNYSVGSRDIQEFMRELRRQIVLRMKAGLLPKKFDRKGRLSAGISYYAVGEYGEKEDATKRPHYHIIVFGWSPHDLVPAYPGQSGMPQWRSDFVGGVEEVEGFPDRSGVWRKGRVRFGSVTTQSISYVAGYVFDLLSGERAKEEYSNRIHAVTGEACKVRAPFNQMSRRPGLGEGWFQRNKEGDAISEFAIKPSRTATNGDVIAKREASPVRPDVSNDPKVAMAGYIFRKRCEALEAAGDMLGANALREARRLRAVEDAAKRAADNTPARLLVREAVKLIGAAGLTRAGGTDADIRMSVTAMCEVAGTVAAAERDGTAAAARKEQARIDALRMVARPAASESEADFAALAEKAALPAREGQSIIWAEDGAEAHGNRAWLERLRKHDPDAAEWLADERP